jgi:uncharacterized alkaline shock family protein YloU
VSDDAPAVFLGLAAHEVPSVVGMAPPTLAEGRRRVLGVTQADEGVAIEQSDDPRHANFDPYGVVAYGANIPIVAESIRERVVYPALTRAAGEVHADIAGVFRG